MTTLTQPARDVRRSARRSSSVPLMAANATAPKEVLGLQFP